MVSRQLMDSKVSVSVETVDPITGKEITISQSLPKCDGAESLDAFNTMGQILLAFMGYSTGEIKKTSTYALIYS